MSDDIYFLRKALRMTEASDDPSTKVGVVIHCPDIKREIYGVNSLPVGINRVLATLPRKEKLDLIVHAELDAICTAARYGDRLAGSTLYLVALDAKVGLYWGSAPCLACSKHVVAAGIRRVVTLLEKHWASPWVEICARGRQLIKEAGLLYEEIPYAALTD
jgi:dCMP deaminase